MHLMCPADSKACSIKGIVAVNDQTRVVVLEHAVRECSITMHGSHNANGLRGIGFRVLLIAYEHKIRTEINELNRNSLRAYVQRNVALRMGR